MLIKVNDIELYYEVKGQGDPLIMVHGNSEDHTIFDTASEVLAKNFTCYLIDSRGHGESTKTNNLDYRIMAEDIYSFTKALYLSSNSPIPIRFNSTSYPLSKRRFATFMGFSGCFQSIILPTHKSFIISECTSLKNIKLPKFGAQVEED